MTMRRLGWSGCFLLTAALGACSVFGSDDPPGSPAPEGDAGPDVGALKEPRGLEVTVPPIVAMEGQTTSVDVTVLRRGGLDGDVNLTVDGLPPEIQVGPNLTIAKGQTSAKLEFAMKVGAKHGSRTGIVVHATSEEISANAPITLSVRGKPGSLDTSFGTDGMTTGLTNGLGAPLSDTPRVVVLRDGKIVLASTVYTTTGSDEQFFAARVDERGAIDSAFAGRGSIRFGTKQIDLKGLAVQGDGKLVLCGGSAAFSSTSRGVVARLSVEGNPDSSFGTLGEASFAYPSSEATGFRDCAVLPSGNIALIGFVKGPSLLFGQLSPNGTLVDSWGGPAGFRVVGSGDGSQLALLPDGRYLGRLARRVEFNCSLPDSRSIQTGDSSSA